VDSSTDPPDDDRPRQNSLEPFVLQRPELVPVLALAVSTILDVLELDEQTPPELIRELEHAAAVSMAEAYEPIAEAASRLAESTEASRTTHAASVRGRAETTAALVSETATALLHRHDRQTERAAADATTAARVLALASVPGHKLEAKKRAVEKAHAARDAAAARTDQRAVDAAVTALAADQAAIRLAIDAEHAAGIVEGSTLQAAAAAQATVLAMMYEIAIDAACRHFGQFHPPTR